MLKSLARPFKQSKQHQAHLRPTVVGVVDGNDIDLLLANISRRDSRFTTSDRVAACEVVRSAIETSSVSSIPEIWYAAKDMIQASSPAECRRAGLRLLKACIANDERSMGTRLAYYRDIIHNSNMEDFDLQMQALRQLTNDGRDVLDLYHSGYPLSHVLISWLGRFAKEVQEIRVGRKRDSTLAWGTSVEENFHELLRYTINALKFNIAAFDESDVQALLREAVNICRRTSQQVDISICCELIDTVMTYGYIPMANLWDVVEILCGIAVTVESQHEQSWRSVLNLVKSYAGHSTVITLCKILEGSQRTEVNSNTMRGAAQFLLKLLLMRTGPYASTIVEIPLPNVLAAYKRSLLVESIRHGLEVANCIHQIIANEDLRRAIPYEVWESEFSPLETVYVLSQTSALQQRSRRHISSEDHAALASSAGGSVPPASTADIAGTILSKFQEITTLVVSWLGEGGSTDKSYTGPVDVLVNFLLDMSPFLTESNALTVIDCIEADHSCSPLSKNWAQNFDSMAINFWQDRSWGSSVRIRVLKFAQNVHLLSWDICEAEVIQKLVDMIFCDFQLEHDEAVLKEALDLLVEIAIECDLESFNKLRARLVENFPGVTTGQHDLSQSATLPSQGHDTSASSQAGRSIAVLKWVTRAMAKIFTMTFRYSTKKAQAIYKDLVWVCQRCMWDNYEAFIEAARILVRLRVTTDKNVYLTAPNNMDSLAACFGRSYSSNNPTGEEAWWYPEPLPYLESDYLETPSTVLKRSGRHDPASSANESEGGERNEIDVLPWLKVVVDVVELGAHWECYSFVGAHFAPQLSNIQLFSECGEQILELRRILCDHINTTKIPPSITPAKEVTKLDVLVAEIRTVCVLIGYNVLVFTKRDMDQIVQSFVLGLSSWEKTAVPCIHGLVVCCYEFPLSVKKFMGQIFTKFQTKITTTSSSPHILEMLLALARLPSLTDNFTLDEYKRVFGMAFKYIQHAYDLEKHSQGKKTSTASSTIPESERNNTYMSQYLLALAYNTISTWFLAVKLPNRASLVEFITRNLILANGNPNDIDEQSLATLDLISRFTYADLDLVLQNPTSGAHIHGKEEQIITLKRWIYGTSIWSMETDGSSGTSRMVVRKPTGTIVMDVSPNKNMLPQRLQEEISLTGKVDKNREEGNDEVAISNAKTPLFSPDYFFLQMSVPMDPALTFRPIKLEDDAAIHRAMGALDRAPVVDFHKIGVLYISPGQKDEREILSNGTGSRAYRRFLNKLGSLCRLKGNRQIYSGGLDTENDADGEYAYAWSDKITQVIFHTTTLMPTRPDDDSSLAMKKRHIGNDYVNIYYDESGLPFNFDVIKSQFNFINIVISPHTVTFNEPFVSDEDGKGSESKQMNYYRVRAYRRDGIPAVFAACHMKTVSESSLPVFVRNLAVIASKFARVWHSDGQYVSNWRYRLQLIRQVQERVQATEEPSTTDSEDKEDLALLSNLGFYRYTGNN